MQVIALPGRRAETETWIRRLLDAAGCVAPEVVRYRHWTSDAEASVVVEAGRLADRSADLLVAKSMGTVVAATAFGRHGFRPLRAVLIGTPYAALEDADVRGLRQFAAGVETLFVQQDADPGGSAAALPAALHVPAGRVLAVPGDDHLYSDTAAVGSLVARWLARCPSD